MDSSEKFCLKWNDFEKNISKSFSQLRQQSGLFDVTLVSSDQQQVSAHRLVLSACSDFFKNIFHTNTHSHPLLYLDGVDNREINLMLDYIYQGEVQIYQEHLDRFLDVANKFQLDGLLAKEDPEDYSNVKAENKLPSQETSFQSNTMETNVTNGDTYHIQEKSMRVLSQLFEANNSEVESKFEELIVKDDNGYRCTVCEKHMKKKNDMRRHLETHLTGLSYECQLCGKSFRSDNALCKHRHRVHNHNQMSS